MKNERINFRVTEVEKKFIEERAKAAGLNVSQYAASATLEKEVILIEGLDEVSYQLSKIGGNLNQLTKKCNEGIITCLGLNETKNELNQIYRCLIQIKRKEIKN